MCPKSKLYHYSTDVKFQYQLFQKVLIFLLPLQAQPHTPEDRLALESQLVLSTAEPLCLDPNPVVSILAKKASLVKQKMGTAPMRRATKKFSQVSLSYKALISPI